MRRPRPTLLALALLATTAPPAAAQPPRPSPAPAPDRARARAAFEDARFGLALHLGVHALLGKGDRVMERDRLPIAEYEKLPARYNPSAFDARTWARAARGAGARYLAVTAKHFDGFCLFDSKLTNFDVVDATPYGRDILRQVADACRAEGLPLFVTYSLLDWHHPDHVPGETGRAAGREGPADWKNYVAHYQGQVREICTNYGPIAGLRFEGLSDRPEADWDLDGTYRLVRELQPAALIACRRDGPPRTGEDVQVFARSMPAAGAEASLAWEVAEPLGESSGYDARDLKSKDAAAIVRLVARSAGHGANLLLTVSPPPEGGLSKEIAAQLADAGRWLSRQGASIYATRPGPVPPQPWGVSTRPAAGAAGVFSLHVLDPSRPILLPDALLDFDARRPGAPTPLPLTRRDGRLILTLPEPDRDPIDTVIAVTPKVLPPDAPARPIRPR